MRLRWNAGGTIRTKLNCIFVVLLAAMIGMAWVTFDRLSLIHGAAKDIQTNVLPATQHLGKLASLVERFRLLEAEQVFAVAPAEMTRIKKGMAAVDTEFNTLSEQAAEYLPAESRPALNSIRQIWSKFTKTGQKIAQQSADNDDSLVLATYRKEAAPLFDALQRQMNELLESNVSSGNLAAGTGASATKNTRLILGGATALCVLICLGAMWFVRSAVVRPLLSIVNVMKRLAGHDLSVTIHAGRKDEIGAMQEAIVVFRDSMLQADRLEAVRQQGETAKEERVRRLSELNSAFDEAVTSGLNELNEAASVLRATAEDMSGQAARGTQRTGTVASAAHEASANVQMVATATEQLAASIRGISEHVTHSSDTAAVAVTEAGQTLSIMQTLSGAAKRIGNVTKLINDIATQTNLLALNATIEAARAGDAGRGFAVVAAEVKSLAGQTERATGEIVAQISGMQAATENAVAAIVRIDETIKRISAIALSIAGSVEEQGAATQEIARNVQEAAHGTNEVSSNITGLENLASETGRGADAVLSAVQRLGTQADELRRRVDGYLEDVKAA